MNKAYYTVETSNQQEPIRVDVELTTEHPLSSYGQPVVIDNGTATPAQNFGHALFCLSGASEETQTLVARANKLSGKGLSDTPADLRAAFATFFVG